MKLDNQESKVLKGILLTEIHNLEILITSVDEKDRDELEKQVETIKIILSKID